MNIDADSDADAPEVSYVLITNNALEIEHDTLAEEAIEGADDNDVKLLMPRDS